MVLVLGYGGFVFCVFFVDELIFLVVVVGVVARLIEVHLTVDHLGSEATRCHVHEVAEVQLILDKSVEVFILLYSWTLQSIRPGLTRDITIGLDLVFLELFEERVEGEGKFVENNNISVEHALIVEQAEDVELFLLPL